MKNSVRSLFLFSVIIGLVACGEPRQVKIDKTEKVDAASAKVSQVAKDKMQELYSKLKEAESKSNPMGPRAIFDAMKQTIDSLAGDNLQTARETAERISNIVITEDSQGFSFSVDGTPVDGISIGWLKATKKASISFSLEKLSDIQEAKKTLTNRTDEERRNRSQKEVRKASSQNKELYGVCIGPEGKCSAKLLFIAEHNAITPIYIREQIEPVSAGGARLAVTSKMASEIAHKGPILKEINKYTYDLQVVPSQRASSNYRLILESEEAPIELVSKSSDFSVSTDQAVCLGTEMAPSCGSETVAEQQ